MKQGTLEDFVQFAYGKGLPSRDREQGSVPVYGSAGIIDTHNKAFVRGPGVVIGRKGTIGSVQWADQDFYPIDTTYYIVLKQESINMRYIYYLLKTLPLPHMNTDVAVPGLNRSNALRLKVSIPSLSTQNQVVGILSAYDDLITNNLRRIKLLEQSARLLYKEWFVHLRFPGHEHTTIVDGVPEGWEKGSLSDFFETASGGTPSRKHSSFYEGEINWVKTQELNESFIFDTEEKITEYALAKSSAKLFPENTLLISIYGGTNIGRTGILGSPSASNQACVALFPKHPEANYIFAQQFFQYVRDSLIALAQGSAQTNISQQLLRKFPMVMPTNLAMKPFMEKLVPIYEQVRWLNLSNTKLKIARDLLLPRLMNGDIDLCNIPELH